MAGNESIERAGVTIYPDLTGFRKKLQADLKAATKGIDANVKIRLIADQTGFTKSVRDQLKLVNAPEFKVKLVADTSTFDRQVARLGGGRVSVRVNADTRGATRSIGKDTEAAAEAAGKKAERILYSRIREPIEKFEQGHAQALAADIVSRVRIPLEAVQRAEVQAYAQQARMSKEAADKKIADENKVTAVTKREAEKRAAAAENEARRAVLSSQRAFAQRRKAAVDNFTPPQLINFGGEGIKPLNLLYASLAALSPLLISVGSSAIQAGAGIAALGAAGIGASLAIGGLTVAFSGILNAIKLRKTTLAQAATTEQNSAKTAVKNAAEELRQKNSLLDTAAAQLRAERDLSDARKQAARDLVDLKNKVRDLQNQEKEDTLSLAEAQDKQNSVNANFFATALDRARAAQDVANAKTKLGDTQLDRKRAKEDLATSVKKGVEGSDKVVNARDAARQARERRAEALASKSSGALANAATKVTSPMAQLNKLLADMSPAARELYNWFVANSDVLKNLQRRIESGVLPGFTDALKILGKTNKDGASTLSIGADAMAKLGGKVGDLAKKLAGVTREKGFRKDFKKIVDNNATAMDHLNGAVVALVRPFTKIFAASSPLLVRFAKYIEKIAGRFADFIDEADKSGALSAFFKRSGDELKRWSDLAGQVSRFLLGIFKGSVGSGGTIIDRLTNFFKTAADWSNSSGGQKQIKDFFDRLSNLPYGQIKDFAIQLGLLFAAAQAAKFAGLNPMTTLIGFMIKADPEVATKIAGALTKMAIVLGEHEHVIETMLALVVAYKGIKAFGALKLSLSAIPGLDKILPNLTKTAAMTVQASVVNVYGGAGIPGAAAGAAPAAIGGASKVGPLIATGLTVVGGVIAASMIVDQILGKPGSALDGAKSLALGPESYAKWSKENAPAFQRFFSMTLPNFITAGGTRGWSSFKDAFYNTFGDDVGHFFSITLPNSINLGSQGSGGYAGLASNLGHFFSTTLPNFLSGGTGGWSGLGTYTLEQAKQFIGMPLPEGIQKGLDDGKAALFGKVRQWSSAFWKWLKGLFGVNSPSTMTAEIGGWLIDGLYNGFVDRWKAIYATLTKWIATNITTPLTDTFSSIGEAIKSAFTNPFFTLTSALTAPIKAAFGWLNSYLITPLNALLGKIGVSPIELLTVAAGSTGGGVGNAIGVGIGAGARLLTRRDGGPVPGSSPHSRADNIPAMLTADEYVQPVNAVKHYGVGFMDSIRDRTFPKYADGGLVAGLKKSQGSNLATDIITGALKGVTLKGIVNGLKNQFFGGDASGGSATGDRNVAAIAEATARAMGASDKELIALMEAGYVESGMRNLKGGDRDSLGFLQQRPSQGWGTPAQITDVAHATRSFITRIKNVNHDLSPGLMAQAVQRSAFPDRYDKRYADAVAVLNAQPPFLSGYSGAPTGGAPSKQSLIAFGRSLQARGYTVSENPAFGPVGKHADGSKHYVGRAIDVNHGAGTSKQEQSYLAKIIPEAHRLGFHTIFMAPGHYNHAHIDFNQGGLVPARKYDTGGTLPPGFTMAYNGTGKNETIRTHTQEKALSGPMRLDRRDIALLAAHIAQANNQTVQMDGRKVAEITNSYTYLPAGV